MDNVVIGSNEYAIETFNHSGGGARLQNGIRLTIEEDDSGKQRASVWEIPQTDKHVISLERGEEVSGEFETNFEIQVTGSDSAALREFIKNSEEIAELDSRDYILTSDDSDLVEVLSQIIERVEEIDDGRPREVLDEMIEGIAALGESLDSIDLSQEILDTDALRAESMIQQAKISNAVSQLQSKIEDDNSEDDFQDLFEKYPWFFGNQYIDRVDRELLPGAQVDFALKSINGYLDIIELKTPDADIVRFDGSHDNWVPRAGLTQATVQLQNYIRKSERLQDYIENEQGVQVLKPRGTVVAGSNLTQEQRNGLRVIESHLTRVNLVTFTDLLERGRRMEEFYREGGTISSERDN
jgi:hypothetical protein